MPRYFFHVRDRGRMIEDKEGIDLPDFEVIEQECRNAIRAVLDDEDWQAEISPLAELHVVDELGRTVMVFPFENVSKAD